MNKFLFHFNYRLKKYLNKVTDYLTENISSLYLESGSGGSTLIANSLGFEFHSYETSEGYKTYMNQLLQANKVTHVSVGKVQKYGRPIEVNPTITHKIASVFDAHLSKNVKQRVIVFLDGRCRVLTALYIHANLSDQDSVLVHDFTRLKYQDILQAYHIIDQADSLVLLQKKTIANDVLQQLKKKYELDIE